MIPQNKSSVCLRIHVLLSYLCNVLLGVDQRFWLTTRRDYRVWWHSQLRWGRRYILHLRLYYLWWRTMVLWRHCGRLLCATLTAESGSKTYSAWHVLCMGFSLPLDLALCKVALGGCVRQLAADVSRPVAGLQVVRVHQAASATFKQRSSKDAHVVLGAIRWVRIVSELLRAVEARAIGSVGLDVGPEAAGAGYARGSFVLCLCGC